MLERNKETVKIIFKNLPLQNHKQAQPAALAALAADKQGKFWEYHDKLFAEKKITGESFARLAKSLDLDMDKFEEDMKSAELVNLMRADIAEAGQLGVTGTPTVFVNGRKLKERSLPGFQTLIDDELRKLKQKDAASGS